MSWHARPHREGWVRKSREEERKVCSAHSQSEVLPAHPCGDLLKRQSGMRVWSSRASLRTGDQNLEATCVFKARRPTEHSEEKWDEEWAQGRSNLQGQEKKGKQPWHLGNVVMRRRKTRSMLLPFLAKIILKLIFIQNILLPQMSHRVNSRLLYFLFSCVLLHGRDLQEATQREKEISTGPHRGRNAKVRMKFFTFVWNSMS